MSIATYDRLLAPFDDDKMNYLTEYHRYELLPEMADFQTGLNLSDRDLFKKTISGRLFWSVYGNKARFSGDETHKTWGGF